ncbi:MAG: hypothetical protein J6564_09845, partial [Gilliamella sp.]|uniref:hypothetical protein n=1 Tax=Gilliamella sp. TaxID=1891236 RepID=UPI0026001A6C
DSGNNLVITASWPKGNWLRVKNDITLPKNDNSADINNHIKLKIHILERNEVIFSVKMRIILNKNK